MAASNPWIAVPTYWTFREDAPGEEQVVFDHPTPLNEDGTIGRMLASFRNLRGDFRVLVVLGVTNPVIAQQAHEKLTSLLKPYADHMPVYLVSPNNLPAFNSVLSDPILDLTGYGNIRNVQLAVPYAAGADAVVGIDDDEIIEVPDFMDLAARYIGEEFEGDIVGGKAGPYFDASGEFRIIGAEDLASQPNIFLKKNYYMNEALKKYMSEAPADGIVRSNVAFGGDMVMSRETIAKTCHDPYIPRGEDYDYVINAKMAGINYYFQPAMRIVHLPPDSTGSQAADKMSKLVADIHRFIYMREKMDYLRENLPSENFDHAYLMPYPGPYLDPLTDLRSHGITALDEGYPEFRAEGGHPEHLVDEAIRLAKEKVVEFFAYRARWRKAILELEGNGRAREVVETYRVC